MPSISGFLAFCIKVVHCTTHQETPRGATLAYPNLYDVTYNYAGWQLGQPSIPFPGVQLDTDFNGLEGNIAAVLAFTQNVIRSDGALNNGIVTFESLSPALQNAATAVPARGVYGPAAAVDTTPAVFDGVGGNLIKNITFAAFKALLALGNVDNTSDAAKNAAAATLTNKSIAATQLTGALQAAQFPALTGDVTTVAGTLAATIGANKVTNAMRAAMAARTIRGNNTGAPANEADLTADQAVTLLKTAAAGMLQSKFISATRDLTLAGGSVAYAGVGFKPSAVIALHYVNATATFGVGFSDATLAATTVSFYGNNLVTTAGGLVRAFLADATAANYQSATVASYDSDGFTLSWTKTGSPTGTVGTFFLCLR